MWKVQCGFSLKVCCHFGVRIDPDERDRGNDVMEKAMCSRFIDDIIKRYYPGLHPAPAITESCIYTVKRNSLKTLTPSLVFITYV